jgi:tetratricopeptide (TPR) repeat protein
MDQRDFHTAQAHLDECLSIWSNEEAELLNVRVARRSGRIGEADARARAAQKRHPANPALGREIRLLQLQQDDPVEVDRALTECLNRGDAANPLELEAALLGGVKLLFLATAAGESGPDSRPASLVAKVGNGAELWLRLRPGGADRVEGLVWRGLARAFLNDRGAALEDFRRALAIDPAHHDARLHLALVLAPEAPLEAAWHYQFMLQQSPPDWPKIHEALAAIYRTSGQYAEASRLLDEVLAVEPDNIGALVERGALATDEGQFDRAEQWLSRARALAPGDSRTNFALASCLLAAGRPTEAKAYHDQYLRILNERRHGFAPAVGPGAPPGRP